MFWFNRREFLQNAGAISAALAGLSAANSRAEEKPASGKRTSPNETLQERLRDCHRLRLR
jgi:hypothetical protein